MSTPAADDAVNLSNCDREPIHIPGLVQSHGALVAFDAEGTVTHVSANARELLGDTVPAAGETLRPSHFGGDATLHALVEEARTVDVQAAEGEVGNADFEFEGRHFDLIVHRSAGGVIAEFELRPGDRDEIAEFALKAHRTMDKIKRQSSIDGLLRLAVTSVRQLTGFDRVMAYRFRHDDSGDVVAEDKVEALEPFWGGAIRPATFRPRRGACIWSTHCG